MWGGTCRALRKAATKSQNEPCKYRLSTITVPLPCPVKPSAISVFSLQESLFIHNKSSPLSQKKKCSCCFPLLYLISDLCCFFFFTILVLPYHTEWKAQRFFFTSDIHSSSPLLYFPVRLKAGRKKQQKYCGPYFYTQKPDSVLSLILSLCNFIHFTDVVLDPYQCRMEVG